jgi:hypothetical protein
MSKTVNHKGNNSHGDHTKDRSKHWKYKKSSGKNAKKKEKGKNE